MTAEVMDVVAIIPARFESSRFPGKPLAEILGIPMIIRVSRIAAQAVGTDNVVIATDDHRIEEVARAAGFKAALTGPAPTGTDRVADAAERLEADLVVNIQGDEPMLDAADIVRVIDAKKDNPDVVVNACCRLAADEDPDNVNIPKVVTTHDGRLIYASRQRIPGTKKPTPGVEYWKQVCIYGFNRAELRAYRQFGKSSKVEKLEDIEILRFLELQIPVSMIEVSGGTLAVDIPEDVDTVEAAMRARGMS